MDLDANWISPFWQALTLQPRMKVCGCKVSPLSVWHVYTLESLRNPILCGGEVTAGDVLQMLLVITRGRAGFVRVFGNNKARSRALARCKRRMLRSVWQRKSNPIPDAIDYAEACMRVASRTRGTGGKPASVPHALHVLRGAVRCGVPFARAWDMPYAEARCLFDTEAESQGDQTLMDDLFMQVDEAMTREKEAANG